VIHEDFETDEDSETDLAMGDSFDTTRPSSDTYNLRRTPVSVVVPQHDTSKSTSLSHIMDNWMYD
jgi:hypothetical protein